MSIQAIDGSSWQDSILWTALRRTILLGVLVGVLVGPVLIGGVIGWMVTREAGPTLGDDGWVRNRPAMARADVGFPLVSAAELEAAGLSLEEARKILRR